MADEYEDLGAGYEDLGPPKSRAKVASEMFTDIPREAASEITQARDTMKSFADWGKGRPISDPYATGDQPKEYPGGGEGGQPATLGSVGRGLLKGGMALGSAMYLGSGAAPVMGAVKSMIGHGTEAALGGDEKTYESAKTGVDIGGALYGGGALLRGGAKALMSKLPTAEAAAGESQVMAERFAKGLSPDGKPIDASPEESFARMQSTMQGKAAQEAEEVSKSFQVATADFGKSAKPAAIHSDAAYALPAQITSDLQGQGLVLVEGAKGTPQASRMMKKLSENINALFEKNQGHAAGLPPDNWNLAAVDQIKRSFNVFRNAAVESGNKTDLRAVNGIIKSFDQHIDNLVNSSKFSGDAKVVRAWNVSRAREEIYRATFQDMSTNPTRRDYREVIEKIIGDNKNNPAAAKEAADYALGSIGVNPPGYNAKVMTGIANILGTNSMEWASVRQGTWQGLVTPNPKEWGPQQIRTRILEFLDGKGKETANAMFIPEERAAMRQFAHIQGLIDTAQLPGQTGQKITASLFQLVTTVMHSRTRALEAGFTLLESRIRQARDMRDLQEKLPVIRREVQRWWDATETARKSNAPTRQKSINTYKAAVTLSNALSKVGISDTMPARAGQQEDKRDKLSFGGPAM